MKFISTRAQSPPASFAEVLERGLAPDGGLYMPEHWPAFSISDFDDDRTLPQVGRRLLAPFAAGDRLEPELPRIIDEAFNFPAPLVALSDDGAYSVLELFHGPTAAFKDFGARFLAACFERLRRRAARTVNVLVATSGDTGGAVAAAFHGRPGTQVTVLFPRGLVSPTQQQQLTCWGDNVRAYAIRGTFDDCQRLVKEAFADQAITSRVELSSANSINLGRLLPQAVYYAASSLAHWRAHGTALSYIIPSGNLGNAAAAVIARRIGLPIGRIVLAHNANATVSDFLAGGHWQPRASVATLASAMDVGNPSNMERLRWLHVELGELQAALSAHTVVDTAIQQRIRTDYRRHGWVWCPHTACAAEVHERLSATADSPLHWCIVATAHAAKFPEIVEPLIGRRIEVPAALAALFVRPSRFDELDATLASLREVLISSRSA